ncbi:MAG: GGDEF domain-containing protein [Rhodanobacter sp.]
MKTHTPTHEVDSRNVPAKDAMAHQAQRGRWSAVVLGKDRRMFIRLQQWRLAAISYVGSSVVLTICYFQGWLSATQLAAWTGTLVLTQALLYFTMRSGLSSHWKDPAMTVMQIVVALIFTNWGFLIAGPGRAIALMSILFVLIFGAFRLHWKKIAVLTIAALTSFGASVATLQWLRVQHLVTTGPTDLRQDLLYFVSLVAMLPLAGALAAQLSHLRAALLAQRGALADALAEVKRLAEFDELTGLANRRHADNYLLTQETGAQRSGSGFSVVLIDLDNFKHINDTLGHEAGDRALRAFADVARSLMRPTDLMARWGGEEFLIIMPDTSIEEAWAAAVRLLEHVRNLTATDPGPISFSAGVAHSKSCEAFANTVARADRRMYAAKHAGRSQVWMTD